MTSVAKPPRVAPFVKKLFHIMSKSDFAGKYCGFSSGGNSFCILDPDEFAKVVLPTVGRLPLVSLAAARQSTRSRSQCMLHFTSSSSFPCPLCCNHLRPWHHLLLRQSSTSSTTACEASHASFASTASTAFGKKTSSSTGTLALSHAGRTFSTLSDEGRWR